MKNFHSLLIILNIFSGYGEETILTLALGQKWGFIIARRYSRLTLTGLTIILHIRKLLFLCSYIYMTMNQEKIFSHGDRQMTNGG